MASLLLNLESLMMIEAISSNLFQRETFLLMFEKLILYKITKVNLRTEY